MPLAGRTIDTGRTKVGAFVGDHSKTSIGALLNTGTLVGPFCQLLTAGSLLPRVVPAFCRVGHGRLEERNDLRQMIATASAVMRRRGRDWTADHAEFFFTLYETTMGERRRVLREAEQRQLRRLASEA
jgi:hypothetical protein